MAQDLVTAKDVAVHADDAFRFQDAQLICEKLDEALAFERFNRTSYSPSVQHLFQQAWAVAAHKSSRQVTIHHLAYALVFNHPDDGKKLAEYLTTDVDSLALGCILQILPLGVSTGDAAILPPAVGTVRWVGHAVSLARATGRRSELLSEHLVEAVLGSVLPDQERAALRKAVRVGHARHGVVLGPRLVKLMAVPPSSSRDIIKHMEEVERGSVAGGPAENPNLVELLEEFDERRTADSADQKQALTLANKRLALIEQRVLPIDDVMCKLEGIDHRVSVLSGALPAPPSGARVAAAIIAVLILGVAIGLALTFWQPGS